MHKAILFSSICALTLLSCATPSQMIDKGQYAQAYQVLSEKKPAEYAAQLERLAAIHFKAKRYAEAKQCYVASRGEEKAGLEAYGDFALSEGNANEAIEAYRKANAWDKAGKLARAAALEMISVRWPDESAYRAAKKLMVSGFPDAAAANREWADILQQKAISDTSSIGREMELRKQLTAALNALNDPAATKSRWKEIARAITTKDDAGRLAYQIEDSYKAKPEEGRALCAEAAEEALKNKRPETAQVYALYSEDKALLLRAAVANGLRATKPQDDFFRHMQQSDGSNTALDRIRENLFSDIRDTALVDRAMADIALEIGTPKYAIRLYQKAGDAEGIKRVNLVLADASLSWMQNPGSYAYWASGSIKMYAAALGSEAAAWKHLGDKLLAAGQKRNAADAYKKAGQPDLAKPLIPGAAEEYIADKKYEEAASLYKEAGMIEEARGALKTWVQGKDSYSFWNGDTEKEEAKTLFRKYWDTKRDALMALSGIAEEAERYDDAAELAEEAGDKAAVARIRSTVLRNALADDAEEAGLEIAKGMAKDEKGAWSLLFDVYAELGKYEKARLAAAKAGRKADAAAFLKKAATNAPDAQTRREIARNLVSLGTPEARKALGTMADDPDPAIAALAAWSTGKGPKTIKVALVQLESFGSMNMLGMAMSANVEATGRLLLAKEKKDLGPYQIANVVEAAVAAKPSVINLPALEDARGVKSVDKDKLNALIASDEYDLYIVSSPDRYARSSNYKLDLRQVDNFLVYLSSTDEPLRVDGKSLEFEFDTSYAVSEKEKELVIEQAGRAVYSERKTRLAELGSVLRFLRGR